MPYGIVKRYSEGRGAGILISDDGSREIPFEFSDIAMDGFKSLSEGQRVSFEIVRTARGSSAHRVTPCDEAGL